MSDSILPYIAGFLDGDGCIMLQLVYRHDYIFGYQIRASIVFYQKSNHKDFLEWLKGYLKYGYIRDRKDNISEYTIVGHKDVESVLKLLQLHLRLKKEQARLALEIIQDLRAIKKLTPEILLQMSKKVDQFGKLNYSKKRKNTSVKVEEYLKAKELLSP
ncbi:MAG: site-specific DNA endonuclease [Candidatus Saganbacteria bacterium]|uniref:Site-specific DNA endonuclease n=1 Tax=Candidatus Saganbacteria bacterium TaxID=2575572 RepID=A0A833L0G2_UNCSA|nr:MAG: site-specific DNA endonuclease [Candidatus Saganbacteria bacterium]